MRNPLHHFDLIEDIFVCLLGDALLHLDLLERHHSVKRLLSSLGVDVLLICFVDGSARTLA